MLLLPSPGIAQQAPLEADRAATVLRPGDALQIEIWREEDLSGQFLVNENGSVTLPLLGDRLVAGIPIPTLRDELIDAYRDQLRNPSISVNPLRRIYVLGEVNRPGLHAIDPTISLAGAVALAGGANALGDIRNIRVVRGSEVVLDGLPIETALTAVDIRSGDQIFIDRRGWFDRNGAIAISGALGITSIVISLLR